jgi:CRISPR-associated protein Cas2
MFILISYDVCTISKNGSRRLRRVAKLCESYGQRVQNSVFECILEPDKFVSLKNKLLNEINTKEDSLRFYKLGSKWQHRIEHVGTKKVLDLEKDSLII